jgi:subtilisin family serine protease
MKRLIPLFLILLNLSVIAQYSESTLPDEYKNLPPGSVVYKFMDGDSISHTRIELPDSLKRYIVEFTEPALYAQPVYSNLKSAQLLEEKLQLIDRQHDQFENDLNQMLNQGRGNLKSQAVGRKVFSQSYRKVFNGAAIQANSMVVDELRRKPYVKRVYSDNMVQAIDDESNQVIKADSVREQYGVTGKGVVIGIIDTGIDNTHPDLSNGKVIGGYDFVNNDDDPMDDHGHGTHCAGIAAANGPGLKGVAPDAKLVAIKVLDEWGNGWEAEIIAGIEYAIDPDGDPATDDGVDIISMSLGGPGNPDDPMSTAVNNAHRKGVLCVIAAGNNGSIYHTIGSPGCAKEAITVGASDLNDYIAYFSSRGPTLNSYEIKPNVLAPGVDIYSSLPHGMYESWNGTSMATPHVAGAAALLKEIHPTWNAQKMRSAIVHSAIDRGFDYDVWTQGNGRVDLMKAASVASSVSKNSINFGLIPHSETTYNRVDSFYVHNLSGNRLNYQLSINDELPSALTLHLLPRQFSLAPSDSQLIQFSLNIDNATLAYPSTPVAAYTGKVVIDDGIQPQNLLFSMIKSYSLTIDFDFQPQIVMIHDNNSVRNYYSPQGTSFSTLLPTGNYDVIVYDNNRFIVREDIDISQISNLKISKKEAKNKVEFKGIDPNGKPLAISDFGVECLILKKFVDYPFGFNLWKIVVWDGKTFPPVIKYFSDFSEKYRYEIAPTVYPHTNSEHNWYDIPLLLDQPLMKDTILVNDKDDFVRFNITYDNIPETFDSLYFTNSNFSYGIAGSYNIYDSFDEQSNILTRPFYRTAYVCPNPDRNYFVNRVFGSRLHAFQNKIDTYNDSLLFISTDYTCFKDSGKIKLRSTYNYDEIEIEKTYDLHLNLSPVFMQSYFGINHSNKEIVINTETYHFVSQNGGVWHSKIPFTFSKGSEIIRHDTILNNHSWAWNTTSLTFDYDV